MFTTWMFLFKPAETVLIWTLFCDLNNISIIIEHFEEIYLFYCIIWFNIEYKLFLYWRHPETFIFKEAKICLFFILISSSITLVSSIHFSAVYLKSYYLIQWSIVFSKIIKALQNLSTSSYIQSISIFCKVMFQPLNLNSSFLYSKVVIKYYLGQQKFD